MSSTVTGALTAMLSERAEWDEAPALLFLYRDSGGYRYSDASLISDSDWDCRPPVTLHRFAVMTEMPDVGRMLSAVAPHNLAGAVFRCESWAVTQRKGDVMSPEWRGHLHEHPDRVETRTAFAVMCDGSMWAASQQRGSDQVTAERLDGETTGLIPESLHRIVRALTSGVN